MKRLLLLFCLTVTFLFSESDFNYHLHLYSINRLSDGGVIKIPFRLANIDFNHQNENIEVLSKFSFVKVLFKDPQATKQTFNKMGQTSEK